ncbi:MAG: peroxiredoxin [Bacteroidetes bacterium]|nr:peroxiredoxin [Bacteroidota bacterium]
MVEHNGANGSETFRGLPRLGEPAPDFEAITTHGMLRLSDFKGSWLILFSHPADFTPVCTTEFVGFSEINSELNKKGVQLLGLSIDSVYSHIAWTRNIEEKLGVKVPFPVIADINREVAMKYGMIMPGESRTETSRCVFFIDPESKLRAMIYYPLTTGRNMQEIIRVVDALQATDKFQVATPANWKPGEKVIVGAPNTSSMAEQRMKDKSLEVVEWYLSKKAL